MDTGKRKDDYRFYEGYEGEKEVIISLPDIVYHIWDGFFEDIFGNPKTTDDGWIGFTRDYNEFIMHLKMIVSNVLLTQKSI